MTGKAFRRFSPFTFLYASFCARYKEIADSGCIITGKVATEGYTFDGSEAVIDGEFVGLPLDEINESDMTDQRIDTWLDSIKGKLA